MSLAGGDSLALFTTAAHKTYSITRSISSFNLYFIINWFKVIIQLKYVFLMHGENHMHCLSSDSSIRLIHLNL